MTAHDWDYSEYGREMRDIAYNGRRICRNCGKEQTKQPQHLWMRVIGYRWEPLVGRCPGKRI